MAPPESTAGANQNTNTNKTTSNTNTTSSSEALCAPNCCFIDLDSLCGSSLFHWSTTSSSYEDDILLTDNEKGGTKTKPLHKQQQHQTDSTTTATEHSWADHHQRHLNHSRSGDMPPPVIALSRSSVSNTSSHASSTLDDEMCTPPRQPKRRTNRRIITNSSNNGGGKGGGGKGKNSHPPNLEDAEDDLEDESAMDGRDYSALHEMLINSLFEDAQLRHHHTQSQQHQSSSSSHAMNDHDIEVHLDTTPNSTTNNKKAMTTPKRKKQPKLSPSLKKPANRRHTSEGSASYHSRSSCGSDILTPSSHKFKKSLTYKRRKVHVPAFPLSSSSRRKSSAGSHASSSRGGISEYSSLASSHNTTSTGVALSFLQRNCQLQKDKGKGSPPGSLIVAHGRSESMKKLGEKIDLLVEMEQDGQWSNASLTRVPAKVMNGGNSPIKANEDIVETRSMLGVKYGFMAMKYGVLVHWSKDSGQAVFILLRKMCSDSFIKDKKGGKKDKRKSKMSKPRRTSAVMQNCSVKEKKTTSNRRDYSYDPLCLGLDPIASCGL